MTASPVWYTTREEVKNALDYAQTARSDSKVDSAIATGTRNVEGLLKRRFYPQTDVRYKDWPDEGQRSRLYRLWLDFDEVVSVSSLVAGGVTMTHYFLEPANYGPPYTHIDVDLSSTTAFSVGATFQRNIAITGVFGANNDQTTAGLLSSSINSSQTTITVSDSSAVGVGTVLRADSEWMIVTNKTMTSTGQTLQTPVGASSAEVTLAVTDGTQYHVDEVLLLDAERMLIIDIAGNNLIVKRQWDGSVLASHTGSTIYALRSATVTRAGLGSTAAAHSGSLVLNRLVIPPLVNELATAEALNILLQRQSGYSRQVGSGDNLRDWSGKGIEQLRADAMSAHGRQARARAV